MIKIENVKFHDSLVLPMIEGTRNALESWAYSDSQFTETGGLVYLGDRDQLLLTGLARKGGSEAKFRRGLFVTMTITAPLYWWKEFDTYKVGTVRLSCSTMHRIHAHAFTRKDFSCEYLIKDSSNDACNRRDEVKYIGDSCTNGSYPNDILDDTIAVLNNMRHLYLASKERQYWDNLIQLLPSSYNQKATVLLNYETLAHMRKDRRNHRLKEWHIFCDMIEGLPFADSLIFEPPYVKTV